MRGFPCWNLQGSQSKNGTTQASCYGATGAAARYESIGPGIGLNAATFKNASQGALARSAANAKTPPGSVYVVGRNWLIFIRTNGASDLWFAERQARLIRLTFGGQIVLPKNEGT